MTLNRRGAGTEHPMLNDPIAIIEYGLYALVNTGRMTYEEIQVAVNWLKEAEDLVEPIIG